VISDTALHCDAADIAAYIARLRKPGRSPAPLNAKRLSRPLCSIKRLSGRLSEKNESGAGLVIHLPLGFSGIDGQVDEVRKDARERRDARPVHQRQLTGSQVCACELRMFFHRRHCTDHEDR